jgi:hypothetical protein
LLCFIFIFIHLFLFAYGHTGQQRYFLYAISILSDQAKKGRHTRIL